MRFKKYLQYLKIHQKLIYIVGLIIEKTGYKFNYQGLKKFRNLLSLAEKSGFAVNLDGHDLVLQKQDVVINLRKNSSDNDVFDQVFVKDEYASLISYLADNNISVKTVVDAGSNIGLTSIKLLTNFPGAKLVCIEPDPANYRQLKLNLQHFGERVSLLENALWYKEDTLFIDFQFRDGKDWSRRVTDNGTGPKNTPVAAISLNKIITDFNFAIIDVLKIDIEGSEAAIFNEKNNLSFLDKVRVIAIEIHDEFNCRKEIYDILRSRNFLLFNSAETTIGINTAIKS